MAGVSFPAPMAGTDLVGLPERARQFASASLADRTWAAYQSDWARFTQWCVSSQVSPLPADPGTVVDYLSHAAALTVDGAPAYSVNTLTRWCSAINAAHRLAGFTPPGHHPTVGVVLAGIRRTLSRQRPVTRRAPLLLGDLETVLNTLPTTWPSVVTGVRDRALLLLGFAGALRRSELSNLTAGDLTWHREDGLHVRVRYSKTDQEAHGHVKALPFGTRVVTCPVCAVVRWLRVIGAQGRADVMRLVLREQGTSHVCRGGLPPVAPATPVFPVVNRHGQVGARPLSGHGVNRVVKVRVAAAGFDPQPYGAHSLRAGFVTQATRAGASVLEVMRQTGHHDPASVETYVRESNPLMGNAVTRIGL